MTTTLITTQETPIKDNIKLCKTFNLIVDMSSVPHLIFHNLLTCCVSFSITGSKATLNCILTNLDNNTGNPFHQKATNVTDLQRSSEVSLPDASTWWRWWHWRYHKSSIPPFTPKLLTSKPQSQSLTTPGMLSHEQTTPATSSKVSPVPTWWTS